MDCLAATLAEGGDFAEAAKLQAEAIRIAKTLGENELVSKLEPRLKLYQDGKPFRDEDSLP